MFNISLKEPLLINPSVCVVSNRNNYKEHKKYNPLMCDTESPD